MDLPAAGELDLPVGVAEPHLHAGQASAPARAGAPSSDQAVGTGFTPSVTVDLVLGAVGVDDPHADLVARPMRTDQPAELFGVGHRPAVEPHDGVADDDPRFVGGAAAHDVDDHSALIHGRSELELDLGIGGRPGADPHERDGLRRVLGGLEDRRLDRIDLDREPDVLGLVRSRRVDPDDLPVHVEQRSTGVPGVDGRIGLDHVVVHAGLVGATLRDRTSRVLDVDLPRQRGDDPRGHRGAALEAEGVSNRHDALPELQGIRVAERHGRQIVGIDVQDRQVGPHVAPDHTGVVLDGVVRRRQHRDLRGVLDHVVVRHDDAVRAHDEPRALPLTGAGVDDDVHDRRQDALHDVHDGIPAAREDRLRGGEVRRRRAVRLGWRGGGVGASGGARGQRQRRYGAEREEGTPHGHGSSLSGSGSIRHAPAPRSPTRLNVA